MKLYHITKKNNAQKIEKEGFKDAEGYYLTIHKYRGVWLSDSPLTYLMTSEDDRFFVVDIPEKIVKKYKWIEEHKGYREFLVPEDVVNKYFLNRRSFPI